MAKRRIKRSRHRFPLMASEQLYRRPIQIIASSGHRALWFSALNLIFFRGKCRTPNAMTLGSYCFVGNLQVLFFATRIVAPSRKGSVRIGIQSRPASRSSRGAPGSGTSCGTQFGARRSLHAKRRCAYPLTPLLARCRRKAAVMWGNQTRPVLHDAVCSPSLRILAKTSRRSDLCAT